MISMGINGRHLLKKDRLLSFLILKIHRNLCFISIFNLIVFIRKRLEVIVSFLYSR